MLWQLQLKNVCKTSERSATASSTTFEGDVIVFSSVFIMLEAKLALAFSQRPSMCEASLLQAVGPDLDYVRSFIDVMVKRLSSGGGCVSFFSVHTLIPHLLSCDSLT